MAKVALSPRTKDSRVRMHGYAKRTMERTLSGNPQARHAHLLANVAANIHSE